MAFLTGSRINTNVAALNALNALNKINSRIGTHQLRLSTGKRINSSADDPAGYTISQKLQARSRALTAAMNNVGEAKNILGVAEGGLQSINDMMITIKEKSIQAGNGSYTSEEVLAIVTQIQDSLDEIDDIIGETTFNGTALLNNQFTNKIFQTGANGGDQLTINLSATIDSADFGMNALTTASFDATNLTTTLNSIDNFISKVTAEIQSVGSLIQRLDVKEATLQLSVTNVDAAASRIMDADIAEEQLEVTKLQILQQTATIQLAQANSSPQAILQLFQ